MKQIPGILTSIFIGYIIFISIHNAHAISGTDSSADFNAVKIQVNKIQTFNGNLPSGVAEPKGRFGALISRIFTVNGKIGNRFLKTLGLRSNNTLLKWSGGDDGKLINSSITDNGTTVGISGNLSVSGNITASAPTANNHVATKSYVDAKAGGGNINALSDAMTDGSSIFLGNLSGVNDDGANGNIGLGYNNLSSNISGTNNTAIGNNSLLANTTGYNNTATGRYSLQSNNTGNYSTAIGYNTLKANTAGLYNVGVGAGTLQANTTGNYNVGIGTWTLYSNTTGSNNIGIGYYNLFKNTTGGSNTAIGYQSMRYNTTGLVNSALGYVALRNNTTGNYNVAIGSSALSLNTTASYNTGVGYNSLGVNTTGSENTGLGALTLDATTTGYRNTGIGYNSLSANTTGHRNTAVGAHTLATNTTGIYNTAIGTESMFFNTTGNDNTAIGTWALNRNTTGYYNTAIGFQAMLSNTTGKFNVANGLQALYYNTTGQENTAIGTRSLHKNTTGNGNTSVGYYSLHNNTTGLYNTSLGGYSLLKNITGISNTAIGRTSLYSNTTGHENNTLGMHSLYYNTTGANNTAIGYQSLHRNTTGGQNTVLGNYSGQYITTGSNNILIGYAAYAPSPTSSNKLNIGNTIYGDVSSKNIGIGTTSPLGGEGDLTLGNSAGADGKLYLYGSTPGAYSRIFTSNGNLHIDSSVDSGSDAIYLNYYHGGNVYVGKSTKKSHVVVSGIVEANGGVTVDNKSAISAGNYAHTAQSTAANHYGYFEGKNSSGNRGFYLGYGDGASIVDLYLDKASELLIRGGNVNVPGKIITSTPTAGNHVATKAYVDLKTAPGSIGGVSVTPSETTCITKTVAKTPTNIFGTPTTAIMTKCPINYVVAGMSSIPNNNNTDIFNGGNNTTTYTNEILCCPLTTTAPAGPSYTVKNLTGYSCSKNGSCETPILNICQEGFRPGDRFKITTDGTGSSWLNPSEYVKAYTFTVGTAYTHTYTHPYRKANQNKRVYDGGCDFKATSQYIGDSTNGRWAAIKITKIEFIK